MHTMYVERMKRLLHSQGGNHSLNDKNVNGQYRYTCPPCPKHVEPGNKARKPLKENLHDWRNAQERDLLSMLCEDHLLKVSTYEYEIPWPGTLLGIPRRLSLSETLKPCNPETLKP